MSSISPVGFCSVDYYSVFSSMDKTIMELNRISSVNSYISEMYYKVLCTRVNQLNLIGPNHSYSGELAFLKLQVGNIQDSLKEINEKKFSSRRQAEEIWARIQNSILQYYSSIHKNNYINWSRQEYDDEYIIDLIATIKASRKDLNSLYGDIDFLIASLALWLSPKTREEQGYKESYGEDIRYWKRYIQLLKDKKIKEAYELLIKNTQCMDSCKSEIAKFKKGLFGMKYLGNVYSLEADTLARSRI